MKCPHLDRYVKATGMMLKLSVVSWLVLAASRWIEGSDLICSGKSWWCVVPSRRPEEEFFVRGEGWSVQSHHGGCAVQSRNRRKGAKTFSNGWISRIKCLITTLIFYKLGRIE